MLRTALHLDSIIRILIPQIKKTRLRVAKYLCLMAHYHYQSDSRIFIVIGESFGCYMNTEKVHFTYFIGFCLCSLENWKYSLSAKVFLSGTNSKQQEWRWKGRKEERYYYQESLDLAGKLSWLSGDVIYLLARPYETCHLLEQSCDLCLTGQNSQFRALLQLGQVST